MSAETAAGRLLAAINSLDLEAVAACIHPAATWQNVPEAPAEGKEAVMAMLQAVLDRCERAQWDVVSGAYAGDTAWLERVDRFWISGREIAVRCNGVFRFDPATYQLLEVRDYADLHPWRLTLKEALGRP